MHATLIDDLVGAFGLKNYAELASLLGVAKSSISHYRRHGLTPPRWQQILLLSRERGVKLPASFYQTRAEAA